MRMLIALVVVSIPLVAVAGRVIVQPLIAAVERLIEQRMKQEEKLPARMHDLEVRLEALERSTRPVLEEIDFRRRLGEGGTDKAS